MKSNQNSDFAGLENLIKKHREQLQQFNVWFEQEQWGKFHTAHYDWWMFPIDHKSSFGYKWTVFDDDIKTLKKNKQFMQDYCLGIKLLSLAWGWNLNEKKAIEHPAREQCWQRWPVRLYKAAYSAKLFDQKDELESLAIYANQLISIGESMSYRNYDYSDFFKKELLPVY